jgi:hypothetical protein
MMIHAAALTGSHTPRDKTMKKRAGIDPVQYDRPLCRES